jgi:arginine decarboxylase
MNEKPLRNDATLLDIFLRVRDEPRNDFIIPGHKRQGHLLDEGLGRLVDGDVPLYGGLDSIKQTGNALRHAESRAATFYDADWCRFSSGGSTHTNQALALALGQPGDVVIASRSLHRSMLLGFVLADLRPVWLPTHIDDHCGLPRGTSIDDVATALASYPGAVALVLTEPGYVGTMSDLQAICELTHQYGVPVLVDQAWGAHFGAHPELPRHALANGADAMVTSTHKLLVGYSQASVAAARTQRLDRDRLDRGFEATQTTSPAGTILASSDASRALMETRGAELFDRVLALVRSARRRLREEVPGLLVPDEETFGSGRFDPTRLIIQLVPLGIDGIEVERRLSQNGISLEFADRDTLMPLITVVDTEESVSSLLDQLIPFLLDARGEIREFSTALSWRVQPVQALSPREAFFARHERVESSMAIGRVSAELVAPYPPGVPVLAPGEVVTRELVEGLLEVARSGVRIAYAADPSLTTLEVVA